jgi:hypothetical protein
VYIEGNIKMDLKERKSKCMNWINLFQDMIQWWVLVNMVMGIQILLKENDLLVGK